MAFIGEIELYTGVNANYHVIQLYTWSKWDNIQVVVDSYISAETRRSGKQPISRRGFEITISENDPRMAIDLPYLYKRLSLMSPFTEMVSDV